MWMSVFDRLQAGAFGSDQMTPAGQVVFSVV
jgi:hypothetical protein